MPALALLGVIMAIAGGIGLLIAAFKTSLLWGIGSFLFTPVALVFVLLHWDVARNPFLLALGGLALSFIAYSPQP